MTDLRYSLLSLPALLAIVASIVVAPSVATAQTAGLDQYVPNPGNTHHGGGGAGGDDGDGGHAPSAPAGTGSSSGGDGTSADERGAGGNGERASTSDGPAAVPTSTGTAEHPLGTIPLTDYPLTPLLLGVFLLLVAGLIARLATYLAGRRRRPPTPA